MALTKFEDLNRNSLTKTGYNPQMISWNGVPFLQRANNFNYNEISHSRIMQKLTSIRDNFMAAFQMSNARDASGGIIDMMSPDGYKYFAQLLHGDAEVLNGDSSESFLLTVMMFNGQLDYDEFHDVYPHVLLNFETMLRDPLAYVVFKTKFLDYLHQYQQSLAPYAREQLLVEGVEIVDAQIGELVTRFGYTDFDVSNLLNDKMHFINGQYQWNHTLLARQMRLENTPFEYNITVKSDVQQELLVRVFIGPKYDETGKTLTLNNNRFNFMELDSFDWKLQKGKNFKTRYYGQFDNPGINVLTYTEKYKILSYAIEKNHIVEMDKRSRRHRWTLPKGTPQGFPIQMFFIIQSPNSDKGTFPFDREINEIDFFMPNMYFKDAKVYHEDILEKYSKGYKDYGHFDYVLF